MLYRLSYSRTHIDYITSAGQIKARLPCPQ